MASLLLAVIYVAFISLGLPDSLLGAAWPAMYPQLHVPVSFSGIVFFIISAGSALSSLMSERATKRLGAGKVTAISVGLTAVAVLGFSTATSFWMLCLWAIPYGLGAGGVDAALNNYVALHFASRHMSWLHCMWGIGASVGPYIMSLAITHADSWSLGYRIIGLVQVAFTALMFLSLPLWGKVKARQEGGASDDATAQSNAAAPSISVRQAIHLPGAFAMMLTFFSYCALEQTVGLWASSYLVLHAGMGAALASGFASLFFIGITVGRAINGFLTLKFSDTALIRGGQALVLAGIVLLFVPVQAVALIGFAAIGFGCAPIYPSAIHATPQHFGRQASQAMVGLQMASASAGTCLMPVLFGVIARVTHIAALPVYLIVLLIVQIAAYWRVLQATR